MGYNCHTIIMKKIGGFLCMFFLLGSMLFLSSCENSSGYAPKNISGKTMRMNFMDDGTFMWEIRFSSNSSATIKGPFDEEVCKSIQYEKTGSNSATIQMSVEYYGKTNNYNYSLIFISPNEGTANVGTYRFTLF